MTMRNPKTSTENPLSRARAALLRLAKLPAGATVKDVAARLGLDGNHLAAAMGVTPTASINGSNAPPRMLGSVRASAEDGVYTLNPITGAATVKVGGTTVFA